MPACMPPSRMAVLIQAPLLPPPPCTQSVTPIPPPGSHWVPLVEGVSGVLKPGRLTLLLGHPGAGKTVLLKALAGQLRRDATLKAGGRGRAGRLVGAGTLCNTRFACINGQAPSLLTACRMPHHLPAGHSRRAELQRAEPAGRPWRQGPELCAGARRSLHPASGSPLPRAHSSADAGICRSGARQPVCRCGVEQQVGGAGADCWS